jgi:hypothetical protein
MTTTPNAGHRGLATQNVLATRVQAHLNTDTSECARVQQIGVEGRTRTKTQRGPQLSGTVTPEIHG